MSGGRCQRWMMMGRGADGGCGTEKKTCPVARISSHPAQESLGTLARGKDAPVEASGINLWEQARKTLTERSPFDAEDQAATERVSTLPVALAVLFAKHSDSRRKHKNNQVDHEQKATPSTATPAAVVSTNVWAETREYFRPVTLADIDHLIPKTPSASDPCFRIPLSPISSVEVVGWKDDCDLVAGSISERVSSLCRAEASSSAAHDWAKQPNANLHQNPMYIDNAIMDKYDVVRDHTTISKIRTGERNERSSLSWLLGLRNRLFVAPERPSKKRRLLGSDAELERVLKLPQSEGFALPCCDYCCVQGSVSSSDQLLSCANCKVYVHQQCYGVGTVPTGLWLCSRCQHLEKIKCPSNHIEEFHCLICPKTGGALKPVREPSCFKQKCKFVHLFCSVWIPELYVDNLEAMEPIMNIESLPAVPEKLVCNVCKLKGGVCIQCSNGTCGASFHPMCARDAKHQMEVWSKFGCDYVELRVFCLKHTEMLELGYGHLETVAGVCGSDIAKHNDYSAAHQLSEVKFIDNNRGACGSQQNALNLTCDQISARGPHHDDLHSANEFDSRSDERLLKELNSSDLGNENHVSDNSSDPMSFLAVKKLTETERSRQKNCDVPQGNKSNDYVKTSLPVSEEYGHVNYIIPKNFKGGKANGDTKAVYERHNLQSWTAEGATSVQLCTDQTGASVTTKIHLVKKDSSRTSKSDSTNYIHPCILKRLFDKGAKVECSDTARSFQLQELSAEDEVEGELVILQNQLLDTCISIKSQYGNLMASLVRLLAEEICDIRKQRWDIILVNQFLREVREAKKRGRKEKRLREAQALLASAVAASASSRLSNIRKAANDEIVESGQEDINKGDATNGSGSDHQTSGKPSKLISQKISTAKTSEANVACCDICRRGETIMNPIFVCGGCKVAVHLDCYCKGREPISSWFCELCLESRSLSPSIDCGNRFHIALTCGLCGTSCGAFRKSCDGRWVHAFCAEWVLGTKYRRGQEQYVEGLDDILKGKCNPKCCICHQNIGITIKCCFGHCQAAFHPLCARNSNLYLNLKVVAGSVLNRKAFCAKHSQEQREKSIFEHIGVEEFKGLKQIRVELEKLRLLCERIVKREKVKRECVLCLQDILASRRDYGTFTVIVRSPLFSSGLSSESATTSVNNTSYSGTGERSDDVTVDSTFSGKPKAILPFHIKIEKASDRSRSNLPMLPAAVDRVSFAGKQLPQRPPSFHTSAIQERRFKSRRSETFHEASMIPGQTSTHNQRLSPTLDRAYALMDGLPKPQDTESQDCHKPDG